MLKKDSSNVTSDKESFSELLSCIQTIKQQLTNLTKVVKDTENELIKELKLEKENKKSKNKGNKQPSGFANPTNVSKQLCEFMENH